MPDSVTCKKITIFVGKYQSSVGMIYQVFKPKPELAHIVEHYWYSKVDLSGSVVQHYPTPLLQGLIFNFKKLAEHHTYDGKQVQLYRQAYFFGQPTSSRIVNTNEKGIDILGVKFHPLGIAKITGINMEHVADAIIGADDIWNKELEFICEEIQSARSIQGSIDVLENFLWNKSCNTRIHYRYENVDHAIMLIQRSNGTINMRELQYETNTSRKTLERAFLNFVGLTPKLYSRITRFNALKSIIDNGLVDQNLSRVAFDLGYADGSHLAAEFKCFANMTPSQYMASLQQQNTELV